MFLLQSDIVKLDLAYSTLLKVNFGVPQKERIFWNKIMFFNEIVSIYCIFCEYLGED